MAREDVDRGHKFGTFAGVFTPSILTILGAIMFMRANFVTGQAGIGGAVAILVISTSITFLTSLSIGAVSTNMQVRGGGAYFLISRVLGPESGGAIGIVLFIAQALSVPFYILGFTEALTASVPALAQYSLVIALAAAGLLFVIAFIGAGWSIRIQYIIMAVLGISIAAFLGGGLQLFSLETFGSNFASDYTLQPGLAGSAQPYSFWSVFAIYFPAVTGILAGVNMSGDLKDAPRSIPRGTLGAIAVGFLIYIALIIVGGGAYPRDILIEHPFEALRDNALWGTGLLVVAGVVAATISSALGSYLGAPRILQAVARDKLLNALKPFARGSARGDEPRAALLLTVLITVLVISWAEQLPGGNGFNAVASLITMFFLYTYGMLNLAAFVEAVSNNPSFRPRFKAFHWVTALLGAVGCVGVAVLIDPLPALGAVVVIGLLYWYLRRRELSATFGDARRGFIYSRVRSNLLTLMQTEEDPKNWRPTILAFSGNPATRELLVAFAVWLESGRGIVQLVNIIKAPRLESSNHHRRALNQLESFCRKQNFPAFPVVMVAEDIATGIAGVLQMASIGPIRPNLALFGWNHGGDGSLAQFLKAADALRMSQVIVSGRDLVQGQRKRRIDVYWRGQANGALLVLLAHLLSRNWEWANARIRLLRVIEREEGRIPARRALIELADRARLDVEPEIVVSREPFPAVLHQTSRDADCIFLGFKLPDKGGEVAWQEYCDNLLESLPTVILVHSAGGQDLLA